MAASNGPEMMDLNTNVEGALMKRILATHQRQDVKKFDPNPLLHAVKDVIQRASGIQVKGYSSAFEGHLRYNPQQLPYDAIRSVSCEFSCKCSGASTTSEVAIGLLQSLGSYSWEAKAVITLAAFAANYGSYFSVSQLYGSNDPFSKSMAFLQLSPNLLKQTPLKLKPEALKVVEGILGLTNYIIEIKAFQSQYVHRKMFASFFAAHEDDLAKAVYLSIQSTVACASILMNTVAFGNEYKPTAKEAQELSDLVMEIKNVRSTLATEMESWKRHIESIILNEDYENLSSLFKQKHVDNMEILKTLFGWSESQPTTIYNSSTNTKVELNKLSGKHVVLYLSNLEHFSEEEIFFLSEKYPRKSTPCEIVWVPIIDESTSWNAEIEKYFKKMRDSMGWYSINDPWKLNKAVIKYAKEEWKFEGESEFVVLNPNGEFVISAPINLFWFLEQSGFQVNYWKTIQLLQETMGSIVNGWIDAGKHIFLFGGEDIKWIQKFVDEAQRVAVAAKIDFVMMYVGKSDLKWVAHQEILEQLKKNSNTIPLSRFTDQKYMSSFWATLRSIWLTEIKTGKSIVDSSTRDDIFTLLSFDASGEGWAAICHSSSPKMVKARDENVLNTLSNYSRWAALGKQVGFIDALDQKIEEGKPLENHHGCYSLELAATPGSTPKKVKCCLCERAMKTFIAYRCCGDH